MLLLMGVIGCGGPPPEATEKRTGDLNLSFAAVSTGGGEIGFIQQVPISTGRNSCRPGSGCGTTFNFSVNSALLLGITNPNGPYNFQASNNGANGVICTTLINLGSTGDLTGIKSLWFPASYANFPSAGYLGSSHTDDGSNCTSVPSGWHHPIAFAAYTWLPSYGVPSASTVNVYARIDVDFPEYGVTNRYLWPFAR
jgi:hypothetical protein